MRASLGLGRRPLLVQTLASVLVFALAGFLVHKVLQNRLTALARASLDDKVALLALGIHENLQERQRDLALLARTAGAPEAVSDPVEARQVLRQLRAAYRWPSALYLLDATGKVVASTDPRVEAQQLGATAWFRQALARSTVEETELPDNKQPAALVIAVPLKRTTGPTAGVLATRLESGWLAQLVQEVLPTREAGFSVSVLDAGARVIYQQALEILPAPSSGFRASRNVEPQDGGLTGWRVEVRQSRAAALALLAEVDRLLLGLGVLGLLVLAASGLHAALRVSFPLQRLTAKLERSAASGSPLAPGDVSADGMLDKLATAISAMASRYEGQLAEAARREDALAQEVADKTAEIDTVYEHSPVGLHALRPDGLVVQMNQRELNWLGYEPHEVLGRRNITELMAPGYAEVFKARVDLLRRGEIPPTAFTEFVRKDGGRLPVRVSSAPVLNSRGELALIHSAVMDLSESRAADAARGATAGLQQALLEGIPSGLLLYREDGQCVLANRAAAELVGSTVEELLEQNFHYLISWRKSGLYAAVVRAMGGEAGEVLIQGLSSFGKRIDSLVECVPVKHGDAPMVLLVASDVSALAASARAMEKLAYSDALTGLPNRRAGTERLEAEFLRSRRSGAPWSVLMVDVDHFKRVNDTFGHDVGDLVLQHVAKVLKSSARATDLVARLGGEEFMVVLPDTNLEDARLVAEKLRAALEANPAPQAGRVTASLGLACCGTGDASAEAVLKRADEGVYRAKTAGRNRVAEAAEPVPAEALR